MRTKGGGQILRTSLMDAPFGDCPCPCEWSLKLFCKQVPFLWWWMERSRQCRLFGEMCGFTKSNYYINYFALESIKPQHEIHYDWESPLTLLRCGGSSFFSIIKLWSSASVEWKLTLPPGASINDVNKMFGFFDLLPPLVRIWNWFVVKIPATSLTMSAFPWPPSSWMQTSYLEAPW